MTSITVKMARDYSPVAGITFRKGEEYTVRGTMDKSLNLQFDERDWYNVPNSYIYGRSVEELLDAVNPDCWTFIHERTQVPRQTVKVFFFKYWHEIPIPTICREERIRCQDVAHMIAVFNEWADAIDHGEG